MGLLNFQLVSSSTVTMRVQETGVLVLAAAGCDLSVLRDMRSETPIQRQRGTLFFPPGLWLRTSLYRGGNDQ